MADTTHDIERAIASKIIEDALAAGYTVDVCDGEAFPLTFSTNRDEILAAMFSTDADTLYFYRVNHDVRLCTGFVFLVYGNTGWDVVADASGNKAMQELLAGADALSDRFQAEAA